MPKYLLHRRYWLRRAEELRRRKPGVTAEWSGQGFPKFIDYWTEIPATYPEKIVFAELVRRRVNFYFSWLLGDMPITPDYYERIRPDFFLPDYNIIIEIYGIYWHTRPGAFESDAYRTMLLIASGFTVYVLNDYEVILDVVGAIDRIPELRNPLVHGSIHMAGERPIQPAASLAARMRRWPKVKPVHWRATKKGAAVAVSAWKASGSFVTEPPPVVEPMMFDVYPGIIKAGKEWEAAYKKWLKEYDWWMAEYQEWVDAYYKFFGYYPPGYP